MLRISDVPMLSMKGENITRDQQEFWQSTVRQTMESDDGQTSDFPISSSIYFPYFTNVFTMGIWLLPQLRYNSPMAQSGSKIAAHCLLYTTPFPNKTQGHQAMVIRA
ncbi:hypothetical protein SCLCIDRAFT_836381 [Scleroderma citrinum Foug A]|uniref:Uncharacterized protein n=1 Tax=Scleroderma citrinum Foug A TaxID=1036808 RepID=A0A0C3E2R6_9AGAM|nr:hypothetical protein SCLCIDRAFT_836381 [Scleroderma citrinum Foug A]